ncbi:hypothetical protein DFJ58DRAFT_791789 [Suillus subalutaceus]|uniref:uncharacterized protein n=1 Tax=Suillus subalutaceus TaxID=48586 RepID=UPI001B88622A|nr:uncharacterized protein DFJ58DRAFT_791789 [Suillus subalutaceus]KAG1852154.1 hypothetical protein DFJ58DRAFT_791789 [Suillus subalutaceus]
MAHFSSPFLFPCILIFIFTIHTKYANWFLTERPFLVPFLSLWSVVYCLFNICLYI